MGAECAAESQADTLGPVPERGADREAMLGAAQPLLGQAVRPLEEARRRIGESEGEPAVGPRDDRLADRLAIGRAQARERGRPLRRRAEAQLHLGDLARQVGMIGQDAAKESARGRAVARVDREVHQMVVDRRERAVERDHPLERGPRVLRRGAGEPAIVDQGLAEAQPAVHVVAIVEHRALVGGDGAVTVAQDQIALGPKELRPARRHPVARRRPASTASSAAG